MYVSYLLGCLYVILTLMCLFQEIKYNLNKICENFVTSIRFLSLPVYLVLFVGVNTRFIDCQVCLKCSLKISVHYKNVPVKINVLPNSNFMGYMTKIT